MRTGSHTVLKLGSGAAQNGVACCGAALHSYMLTHHLAALTRPQSDLHACHTFSLVPPHTTTILSNPDYTMHAQPQCFC